MSERVTAKSEILRVLAASAAPLAVHEMGGSIVGYSENALATRVSELHAEGKIVGRTRLGQDYKEWRLATPAESAHLLERRKAARRAPQGPVHQVVAVQPGALEDGYETALIRVPVGTVVPGQGVRFA